MIEVLLETGGHPDVAPLLEAAVRITLEAQGVVEGEVSLTLLDDDDIRTLNREHLGHDRPTDVISFALWSEGEPVLGDVYIGFAQAARQSGELGVPLREELARLAIHGTLHVLGHDHPDDSPGRAASPMYRLQERLLTRLLATPPV
ncbi:MAG: rRNA maturation RNase YbeY [Longimicrobiales bacterium]|nr:rRNA maturation RNase YbeY [Longimicrobiales bacterium]